MGCEILGVLVLSFLNSWHTNMACAAMPLSLAVHCLEANNSQARHVRHHAKQTMCPQSPHRLSKCKQSTAVHSHRLLFTSTPKRRAHARITHILLRVAGDEHMQLLVFSVIVLAVLLDTLLHRALASDGNLGVGLRL